MAAQVIRKHGFIVATAAQVREWARDNGLNAGGARGQIPKATKDAFNKAHGKGKGRMYYSANPVGENTYTLIGPKGGVQKTWTGPSSVIREWNAMEGNVLPAHGRLPLAAIEAFMREGV